MFLPQEYIVNKEINEYKNICSNLINYVNYAINHYFSDKKMFSAKDFNVYLYDDYIMKTNTNHNGFIQLYIEINQPANIKSEDISKKKKIKDNKVKELHLTLEEIKEGLFQTFVAIFGENTLVWLDKYSIKFSVTEFINNEKIINLFQVTPCFTYENENKVKGVIYYDKSLNNIEIEYPKLSLKNFNLKNKLTKNLYGNYVLMFKNMFRKLKQVGDLPTEIFEIMLYNVPNELFIDVSNSNIAKIINYLRNKDIKDYKTLDEQDFAFTSKYKSLSILYAKSIISTIEKFMRKNI